VATTQRVVLDGHVTAGGFMFSLRNAEPVERYLEFGRQRGFAPNTIKAYARGLAQWWTYLETSSKSWDAVEPPLRYRRPEKWVNVDPPNSWGEFRAVTRCPACGPHRQTPHVLDKRCLRQAT
jgi:hypothetical protein